MTSGEQDYTKRMKGKLDHWWIKGVELQDPTVEACMPVSVEGYAAINHAQILGTALKTPTFVACVPTSIENDAIAYDAENDRFKVDIEAVTLETIDANVTDRAARLVGKVYGNQDVLQQRATTKELIVQIRHEGAEIDPRNIRALTSTDIVTTVQATATRKQFTDTWAAAGNKTAWDPAAGKKVRLKLICLELSADVDLGYRWGTEGTIYYLRTTAGPIVINLIGCNDEGATDEILYLYASGACTVKGHFAGEEI